VALDERRAYFRQNLWASSDLPPGQDVKQVWFPGVHCDVGGGYVEPEAGLSKVALAWMLREAEAAGVRFQAKAKAEILPTHDSTHQAAPNPMGTIHESLVGFWWIIEYLPKRVRDPQKNFEPHWILPCGRRRSVASDATIHEAVLDRIAGNRGYQPNNLGNVQAHPIEREDS
jgi:uncharacterized protein (DUF2235 family)